MFKTYRTGRRLTRIRNLSFAVITLEVLFFYLVYLYILQTSYPQFAGAPLALVFLVIEALLMIAVRYIAIRYQERTAVSTRREGLHVTMFFGELDLPWDDFVEVQKESFASRKVCPIYFIMKDGRHYQPCQYLDDVSKLCQTIIDQTRDHLTIGEDVEKDLKTYQILGF